MVDQYRGLDIRKASRASIPQYMVLFQETYSDFSPTSQYLEWLYFDNPNGEVIGYDAFDGDKLVAHYVCVPIQLNCFEKPSLLALNTATHPKYQGRGLLKVLAERTYAEAIDNYSCVVGVANAQAIKPLTKHLGFLHLGNLELRFGKLTQNTYGRRVFSAHELNWRASCPGRPLSAKVTKSGLVKFKKLMFGFVPISAYSPITAGDSGKLTNLLSLNIPFGLTLDWQKNKSPKFFLPARFKPSPLCFVFRPLIESDFNKLEAWTFQDFDAI